ncbi:MnP-atypical-a, class II peroxidase [Cyathus striatus]|nr:MnP-atypical-a, class II peroxidase [Cyathus striatus]
MAFAHLATLITLALGVSQVANTTLTKCVTCANGHVTSNQACCALFPIVDNIQQNLFDGGECGEEAHSALRLAFHDAIGFSLHRADRSILLFNATETAFRDINDITSRQFPIFQSTGLTPGDFVHLTAAVSTANCPGAPRLQFMFGHLPPVAPALDLMVPRPTGKNYFLFSWCYSVTAILACFANAGFSAPEVIALLSSHTITAADIIDTDIPGTPFDFTVGTFDTQIFLEVLLNVLSPIHGEMRLQSDFKLTHDPRTACLWQAMINDQNCMQTQFKAAMAKLQVLGQNTRKLIDCSDIVPIPAAFPGPIKFPASFSKKDIQQACPLPFPNLQTVAGPAPTLAPV